MIGDALVSAAFVSYIGPFSAKFRYGLWQEKWIPDMTERKVPFTEGIDPLKVLANDSDQAVWKTQGLPADRVSLENAAVVVSCNRYPLLIDPQL
jgi:dynein heavy chain